MHPSQAEGFEWDDGNLEELARHSIRDIEVEQVFENEPKFGPNRGGRSGDWKMIGRTNGGRVLTIIVLAQPATRTLRAITGWNSTTGERRRYVWE